MNNTSPSASVQGHPSSIDNYIRHGWKLVPIPQGTKGPTHSGWNRIENCLTSASALPPGSNYGLAHAYSGTMALDLDNWDLAQQALKEHGIDLQALYDASDAVTIESGRPGHGKLIYQMPFGLVLPTKKITIPVEGVNTTVYELRCGTKEGYTVQDVLPSSIHPQTLQPYRWGGRGHWSRLPTIPAEMLTLWNTLLEQENKRDIPVTTEVDTSWEEIQSALGYIDPSIDRDDWVHIGMALHFAGTITDQSDYAFNVWDQWSAGSQTKYRGRDDLWTSWRGFKPNGGVTLGTLFKLAKEGGWKRPVPSAEEIFGSTSHVDPAAIIDATGVTRAPIPVIDMNLFPPVLTQRAYEVSESVGCDPLVPLFAGLATASGVADARIKLELMPGYRVPPVLWICTLGKPADKKSPGSRPMMSMLKEIEREDIQSFKQRKLEWEGKEAVYNAAHKAYLEHITSADGLLDTDVLPDVPDLPKKPVPKRIVVDDITSQKLAYIAADRPAGLLCWMDEMRGWASRITNSRSGDDRSTWTKSYEAEWAQIDRVAAGEIICENLAVAIYGNIQPSVFREFSAALSTDGTIQRFIPAILDAKKSRLNHPIPEAFSSKDLWAQTVRMVHTIQPTVYRLSPEAYDAFREFQVWYYTTKAQEELLDSGDDTQNQYMTAFGKMEGQCGRLALVMHLIEQPFAPEVSGDLMRRAVALCKGYIIPALRYLLGEVSGQLEDSIETWVTQYVLQIAGLQDTVTLRELKRGARRKLEKLKNLSPAHKDNMFIDVMAWLQQCQWVRLADSTPTKGHYEWVINPALVEQFREQREEIIKAKQARLDLFTEGLSKRFEKEYPRRFVKGYEE